MFGSAHLATTNGNRCCKESQKQRNKVFCVARFASIAWANSQSVVRVRNSSGREFLDEKGDMAVGILRALSVGYAGSDSNNRCT